MLEGYADNLEAAKSLAFHIINGSSLEDTTVMIKKEVEDTFLWTYADGTPFTPFGLGSGSYPQKAKKHT